MCGKVLLSFDVEEFDLPKEHGVDISLTEGLMTSAEGLRRILRVLDETGVKATFFCTGNFAEGQSELVQRIIKSGHEVACHGVDHFRPVTGDIEKSKKIVEKTVGVKAHGYRQPRMQRIDYKELKQYGYRYDSSVNPAFIPGRYNNSKLPKEPFVKNGILEIPTSVATFMRVPMFWLALHLFPKKIYYGLAKRCLKRDGYFATYFHPWEFANLMKFAVVPWYIKKNSGVKLEKRLRGLILDLKGMGGEFITYEAFERKWRKTKGGK